MIIGRFFHKKGKISGYPKNIGVIERADLHLNQKLVQWNNFEICYKNYLVV